MSRCHSMFGNSSHSAQSASSNTPFFLSPFFPPSKWALNFRKCMNKWIFCFLSLLWFGGDIFFCSVGMNCITDAAKVLKLPSHVPCSPPLPPRVVFRAAGHLQWCPYVRTFTSGGQSVSLRSDTTPSAPPSPTWPLTIHRLETFCSFNAVQ